MSLFDTIRSLFSGGARPRGKRLYIIDAAPLHGSGGHDRLSPRDQIQVLQQLARMADKENINIQAVFEGRALREVAHGGSFSGVTVYFADKTPALHDLVLSLLKKGSRSYDVTVITGHRQLEQRVASAGGLTMRPSTLRKAMENGGGGGGGDRDRGPSQRRRRPPRQRDRDRDHDRDRGPQRPAAPQQPSETPQAAAGEAPVPQPVSPGPAPEPARADDGVSDLIDLV
jgi:hypothetical protein